MTVHTARCVKIAIQANFSDKRVASRSFTISWPARSPDLNTCDSRLWDFFKDHVYQGHVNNLGDFKANNVHHVCFITTYMLHAAVDKPVVRFQHVVGRQDIHTEHIDM